MLDDFVRLAEENLLAATAWIVVAAAAVAVIVALLGEFASRWMPPDDDEGEDS